MEGELTEDAEGVFIENVEDELIEDVEGGLIEDDEGRVGSWLGALEYDIVAGGQIQFVSDSKQKHVGKYWRTVSQSDMLTWLL